MDIDSKHIDLNADLGEGTGNDEYIMPYISSCSIACGGHYGNEETMQATIKLATKHNVKIGAHPSFPDEDNFGRRVLTMTKSELTESIFQQVLRFQAVCEMAEVPLHHIKLHGALYNYAAIDAPTADAVVEGIIATKLRPKLYVPHHSILAKKADNLLPVVYEAFIDRRYNNDFSLLSRDEKDALIQNPVDAWQQLYDMIALNKVTTIDGSEKTIIASTYCIHGDHQNSIEILRFIHSKLLENSIEVL